MKLFQGDLVCGPCVSCVSCVSVSVLCLRVGFGLVRLAGYGCFSADGRGTSWLLSLCGLAVVLTLILVCWVMGRRNMKDVPSSSERSPLSRKYTRGKHGSECLSPPTIIGSLVVLRH